MASRAAQKEVEYGMEQGYTGYMASLGERALDIVFDVAYRVRVPREIRREARQHLLTLPDPGPTEAVCGLLTLSLLTTTLTPQAALVQPDNKQFLSSIEKGGDNAQTETQYQLWIPFVTAFRLAPELMINFPINWATDDPVVLGTRGYTNWSETPDAVDPSVEFVPWLKFLELPATCYSRAFGGSEVDGINYINPTVAAQRVVAIETCVQGYR